MQVLYKMYRSNSANYSKPVKLLFAFISSLALVSLVNGACYSNRKFPIVLNTETNKNDNYLSAVTADSTAIYAAGYAASSSNVTSTQIATITRTNISTMAWAWRRVYTESTDRMNTITALALNPSGTKVAAYGWKDFSGSNDGYVFAVDALSGWKVSEVLKIEHGNRVMEVKSARMLMDSNDIIYMAFY